MQSVWHYSIETPRKPSCREKRVTDKSRMSCLKVASLGKVTQFHVGEIRHSFHVFCFFATNKSEKGTNKIWKRREKTWKTMNNCVLFPFKHFATFLRINILRAWNPKPKSRIVVVKVAWKSVVLPTVKWQVLQKSQEICCNFGVCKAISVLEIVLQDSVPVLNLESETQSRNMRRFASRETV